MKRTPVLAALVLATGLSLSACAGTSDGPQSPSQAQSQSQKGTVAVLRDLTGLTGVDEGERAPVDEQSSRSDVVVTGAVTDVVDRGPADPAGSVTHVFELEVTVDEVIKGAPADRVRVTTFGVGEPAELKARLGTERGLWLLSRSGPDLVPVQTTSVLFEEDGQLVSPLAEPGEEALAGTLAEAVEKAKKGKDRKPAK